MALGSLSGPARVDGAWLWGVHLHVQVGAQRNRRVEPHPAQRAAPGSASASPANNCLLGALSVGSRAPPVSRARSTSSASLGRVAKPSPARPAACAGVPFLRANRRATLLTTRQGQGPAATAPARAGAGTEVRASVGPYIMSVMKNMYQKSLATIIGQARARAAECMLIRLGQVRDPRRTSDHQMSGCLPYAGWLATPPSLQHLAVAW